MLDPKERFRNYSLRSVFDGILYIVKTGVQWRMLPSDFAPWQTVYYYFSKWKNEGLLEEIIDSRSVRTSHHIDGQRGIDGNKKIKGRKEHIMVDALGPLMSVRVHPANVHDSVGAEEVFESMRYKFPGLKRTDLSPCQKDGLSSALSHGSRTSGDLPLTMNTGPIRTKP